MMMRYYHLCRVLPIMIMLRSDGERGMSPHYYCCMLCIEQRQARSTFGLLQAGVKKVDVHPHHEQSRRVPPPRSVVRHRDPCPCRAHLILNQDNVPTPCPKKQIPGIVLYEGTIRSRLGGTQNEVSVTPPPIFCL